MCLAPEGTFADLSRRCVPYRDMPHQRRTLGGADRPEADGGLVAKQRGDDRERSR